MKANVSQLAEASPAIGSSSTPPAASGAMTKAAPRFIPSVAFTPEGHFYVIPIGSAA